MQRSRFVIEVDSGRENERILYNVLSDRYVGVNDAVIEMLQHLDRDEFPEGEEEAMVVQELVNQGFLVENRGVDDRRLREHLESVARDGMRGVMYVTLMPTLKCNLACTYCFQKDSPAFNRMTTPTEEATLEFILRKVDEAATPKLFLHYFGGEPLTRPSFILRTAEILSASMAARGGTFEWSITTNGVNLTRPFVEELKRFGTGFIKVTLDGDKETHDQARVYRSGKGSFDIIFNNLIEVAGHVRLFLGGNFMPDQEESYMRLIQRLEDAGIASKFEALKFKPVQDTARSEKNTTCGTCNGCSVKKESEGLSNINNMLQEKKLSSVRNDTLNGLRQGPCELHWDNSYIIDPDGLIYKCPAVAGRPEVAIGSVNSKNVLGKAPLLELRPWEQCGDCAYLPVCVGGCLGGQYLKTGRRDLVNCKKEWFEVSYHESVQQCYLEELGDSVWENRHS